MGSRVGQVEWLTFDEKEDSSSSELGEEGKNEAKVDFFWVGGGMCGSWLDFLYKVGGEAF